MKKFNEFITEVENLEEKNKPTQPEKWARAKAAAKSKFAVYPSAYANAWASKKYKALGGGWRSTKEEVELDEMDKSQKSQERHGDYPLGIKNKDVNMVKPITSKKVKKDTLELLNKLLKKEEVELDERSDYASRHPITKGIIGGRDKGAELFGGKKQYDTLANRRKPGHEVAHAKALGHQGGDEKEQQAKLKTALKSKNEEVEFYEEYDTEELFDILEEVVDGIAEESNIDPDILWENLEDVTDEELFETAAWRRKEGKNPTGGLNRKGIMSYRRENPGSKLSMAVTGKVKPGSKAAKRRKSFCARMGGMKGPMKKPNGEPTRKALALRKWKCR